MSMSTRDSRVYPVNRDFHTAFDLDEDPDLLLGIRNDGRSNRRLITRDAAGETSFTAVLNQVQYGTYDTKSACLVVIEFAFHFKPTGNGRYSYAKIQIAFTRAVDIQNHRVRAAKSSDDPRVGNLAPKTLYGTVKTAGEEKFYNLTVPAMFEMQIGSSDFPWGSIRQMTEHHENRTSANGRLYYDDDSECENTVCWELYENKSKKDGIFHKLVVALIVLNPPDKPMWMEVVVKPSVRFSMDPHRLLEKNSPFARLLQMNDHPVLLDGKTSKQGQSSFGPNDFSSSTFPWQEVLQLPIDCMKQSTEEAPSTNNPIPQRETSAAPGSRLRDLIPYRTPSQQSSKHSARSSGLHRTDYNVAWICALPDLELLAARLMLDEVYTPPFYDTKYDENTYVFGGIKGHRIVVACLPKGQTGNAYAARLTGPMFKTFPNVKIALLVGIGGGVPRPKPSIETLQDVHVGDVVVGWPGDGGPAVVYYDSGRSKVAGVFEMLGTMNRPEWNVTQALGVISSKHILLEARFKDHLSRLKKHPKFAHPGFRHDRLFKASYHHIGEYNNQCMSCDLTQLVQRPPRTEEHQDCFVFHQGRIATGNSVIQDGERRDQISKDCSGVLCIEMEAAGVDVNKPCLVIRGISDYADSHKDDVWKFCAAANAAAFARELLLTIPSSDIKDIGGNF